MDGDLKKATGCFLTSWVLALLMNILFWGLVAGLLSILLKH